MQNTTNFHLYNASISLPLDQIHLTSPLCLFLISLQDPNMCLSSSKPFSHTPTRLVLYLKTETHVHIPRLSRRRKMWREERELEMNNIRLYMENQYMIQENEKLRKKALILHQENKALLSLLQTKNVSIVP
ncbi:hypothetical protein F2Q69_00018079 [Brassica cretica]|uniref:Uncharacterized protein n=1 Tax=Brassica cretica TaxID=69181 RepID=A0A8S9R6Q1_BRACR|nr:hypothetical protein F2Q69_00018079 [Brassica cretica]